jgi:hypothetical protein
MVVLIVYGPPAALKENIVDPFRNGKTPYLNRRHKVLWDKTLRRVIDARVVPNSYGISTYEPYDILSKLFC